MCFMSMHIVEESKILDTGVTSHKTHEYDKNHESLSIKRHAI